MNRLILVFEFLILISCSRTTPKFSKDIVVQPDTKQTEKLTSKDLDYEFKITYKESEDFTNFKTYWDTKLYIDNKLIFTDSLTEFEIKDKYPSIRKIGNDFEILLFVNDRPSIDKLMMLKIHEDIVNSKTLIPFFNMTPKDIDSDGKLEIVGIMSYYEMAGDDGNMMPYVPILVYNYTDSGITLDSTETKNVNVRVYDKFYGFDYTEKYEFEGSERFENELNKYK